MINLPFNVPLVPQNAPMQTSPNNFQAFPQPQQVVTQMQTSPSAVYPGPLQDPCKQPFYQLHQSDVFLSNNQYVPGRNPYQPMLHTTGNVPASVHTQPGIAPLPQNILDQIRGYVSNTTPIFILPSSCHQPANNNQQPVGTLSQGGAPPPIGQSTAFNYPPSIYCPPPSFYPYPIPLPVYEPFAGQARCADRSSSHGCCPRIHDHAKNHPWSGCCCNAGSEEHRCTPTTDDTICSTRNCPASISLQALASQFLSLPGIISCAATRLVLRKVPGSNITTTMEDTMDKAQMSISVLAKDQLLAESRTAQQLTALINLHMTTNLPANLIPFLTLLQLKVNVLKAQVEALINKKVMECQGYGYEVESSGPIDPAVLALKTNAELRQLLAALRQKECDERVNVNFSPYHSQRVIAESRLRNVQAKICQVEAEFENRRTAYYPTPTMTARIIQQFAESRCTFGFAQARLFDTYAPENALQSPDPFEPGPRNPRRLYLKPHVPEPMGTQQDQSRATNTSKDNPSASKDKGTGVDSKEDCQEDTCSCKSSSEDSLDEDKKKLQPQIERMGDARMTSVVQLRDVTLLKLTSNVVTVVVTEQDRFQSEPIVDSDPSDTEDTTWRRSVEIRGAAEENDGVKEARSSESKRDSVEAEEIEEELEEVIPMEEGKTADSRVKPMQKVKAECSKTLKQSEVAPKEEQVQRKCVKKLKAMETREAKTESSKADETQGEKPISEDVPKGQETESEQMAENAQYSGSHRSFCGFRWKRTARRDSNKTDRINPEIDESRREYDERENVRIVSMMTSIEYDRRFSGFGKGMVINGRTNEKGEDRCRGISVRDSSVDTKMKVHACPSSNEIDSSMSNSTMVNMEKSLEKMFGASHVGNDAAEKVVDGIRYFPPLKYATQNRRATATDISESVFHGKETESSSSRIFCDRSTSYHCDTVTGNGIVSAIRSMIESQLDTFGSLLGSIPNLQHVLSNLYLDKLWNRNKNVSSSKKETRSLDDDWILLPEDIHGDERNSFGVDYISVSEERNAARKIRHSIIVDKERKNWVVIGGSMSGQLRVLSKNGFDRPYKVRRSLVIRSRLKDSESAERKLACPFKVLKRCRRKKLFAPRATKGVEEELISSRKSCCLFKGSGDVERSETIIPSDRTIDSLIYTPEYKLLGEVSRNATPKRSNESIDSINRNVVPDECPLPENGRVTDGQDCFTVQEQTSV